MKIKCPLCNTSASLFYVDTQSYYKCSCCCAIFVDKKDLPDKAQEKERYELHSDDSSDEGYRNFVAPLTSAIREEYSEDDSGLDFGAGNSMIVSSVLQGYKIANYDPFFHIYPELLEEKYDYISSCEVIEHFYTPYKEFKLLKNLLKKNAKMYLMTGVYNDEINFEKWYYKNDVTHVFFYTKETFEWIKKEFGFSSVKVGKRLVVFES